MNEIRRDYLLNRYSIISPDRTKRPVDTQKKVVSKKITCPFCPGNEYMTPKSVQEVEKDGRWNIRVIRNKFPAVNPEGSLNEKGVFHRKGDAYGFHEVIIESRNHNTKIQDGIMEDVVKCYIDRYLFLSGQPFIKYVQIFRNYGERGGASLVHPHTQIIALPQIPRLVKEEMDSAEKYRKKHKSCIFCGIAKIERKTERLVLENSSFAAIAPFASRFPYEIWIIPKHHISKISDFRKKDINEFSYILSRVLSSMEKRLGDPAYNFIVHQAPADNDFHLHVEILPVISTTAGFEKSTDIYINTMPPESVRNALLF